MSFCTTGKHEIDTDAAKPIYRANHRTPIHYEKKIEEEIKKT